MACRVGITTRPDERKQYWKRQHPKLRNWRIINWYGTKTAAQERESLEAERLGCVSHPGGSGDEHAKWYVYHFEY